SVSIRVFKRPKVFCPKNKKKKNLSIAGVEKNLPTLSSSLAPTPTDSEEEDRLIEPVIQRHENAKNSKYHVALTATDAPYSQWQCRIMYYWYKKVKDMPGSDMGKFTRVLHSGTADNLMEEIPTVVVDPLPGDLDRGYIVLNRPWAFVQWLEKATIEEEYILMAEPDHIFVNPLPNLAHGNSPAGYPFFYIIPAENEKIIRKFYPEEKGPVTDIDPIGNSPVIIKKSLLEEIAPTWVNVSLRMKDDPETDKAFGWVLEMYAYAVASALHGVRHILRKDFMLQGELTYGKIGEWRFDKRSYLNGPPPRNLSLPLQEFLKIRLVKMVNEATANIPGWNTLTSGEMKNRLKIFLTVAGMDECSNSEVGNGDPLGP
ncbi:hypothetical protein Prudu_107S001200, partial [Prunus dulcis]